VPIFTARVYLGGRVDDVFDEAALLETVHGDRDLVGELGQLFLAEAPGQVEALRDAITRGDAAAVRFAAHTIKGSAATLTARRVAQQALLLETMGKAGTLDGAGERLQALEAAIAELRQRLGSIQGG
jgi:two-component system sensor histidine kinase/response regulator